MTASISHPAQTGIDLFMIARTAGVLDAVGAGVAEQHENHTLQAQEQGQGDDERRNSDPGDHEAYERADRGADDKRDEQRGDPVPPTDVREQDENRHAQATRDAGRQVDFGKDDHERQRHRQHHQRRGLSHQVGDVGLRKEERSQDPEHEADNDHARRVPAACPSRRRGHAAR